MIQYIEKKDIFSSQADALINPVNCRGKMGKGIALEFKKRFPELQLPYEKACDERKLVPGKLIFVRVTVQPTLFENRPAVIMFPTKEHWKGKSKLEWIDKGLAFLKNHYREWGIKSIAMPAIGCGFGGLKWAQVQPLIEKYLGETDLDVEVYLSAVREYEEEITNTQ